MGQGANPMITLKEVKAKVECLECGRKFQTSRILPVCPKCGGSDVEIR